MADIVCNVAFGRLRTYVENVKTGSPANSRLLAVPLEATGLVADDTLRDYDDLSALLGGASNEQTTMGRKTIAAAGIVTAFGSPPQDDVNNRLDLDISDLTWTAASGNALGKLVICYIPDGVTPGADTTAIPMLAYDFVETPTGSDIVAQVHANGLVRIS